MAISIKQQPYRKFLYKGQDIVYVLTSTNIAEPKFKYIYIIDDGLNSQKFYISPNTTNYGVINLENALRSNLKIDGTIYQGTLVNSQVVGGINGYTIKFGEVYEVAGVMTEFYTPAVDQVIYILDGEYEKYRGFEPIAIPEKAKSGDNTKNPWMTNWATFDQLVKDDNLAARASLWKDYEKGVTNEVTTLGLPMGYPIIPCDEQMFGLMSLIWDTNEADRDATKMRYRIFDDTLAQIGADVIIIPSILPTSTVAIDKLIHFPAYPQSVYGWSEIPSPQKPISIGAANWYYYEFQLLDALDVECGAPIKFVRRDICTKDTRYCLTWVNKVGGYDRYTFSKAKDEVLTTSRKTFNKVAGNYATATGEVGQRFVYDIYNRVKEDYQVESETIMTLNTDVLQRGEFEFLKNILKSKEVFLSTDYKLEVPFPPRAIPRPVTVVSDSFQVKSGNGGVISNASIQIKL